MKTYWRLLGFAKPIGKYAVPYFFYMLLFTVLYTCNFVLIMPIIEALFNTKAAAPVTSLPAFALSTQYIRELISFCIYKIFGTNYDTIQVLTMLGIFITTTMMLSGLFRYLGQLLIEKMRITTLRKLRSQVFDNVMELNVGFLNNERKGDIISKISSDVQVVQYCFTNTLQAAFRDPLLIISYLVVLVAISWKLTIFAAVFLPIISLVIGVIVKRLRKNSHAAQQSYADMVSMLDESITGMKIIKAYNATDYIKGKFDGINKIFSGISYSMARRQQLASPMSEFLGIVAVAVILVYGGMLVGKSELDPAAFLVYLAIFSQITRPVRSFADAFANINQGIAAGERVLELMDTKSDITDAADSVELKDFSEGIEFRDVHFSYGEREIIKGVSFKIRKGETVALVGPSGGGKSTLSDLIPRFYDVQGGAILIDGVDIRNFTIDSLRAHMGVVAQETILFNDSIEQNIRLAKREATEAEVIEAAKVANADEFIRETSDGYQTNIGDRGMKLSGGQRQRLSIARAVLKNPDILILDEATSALDTESEKLVQQALETLLKGRTSLVIAHRLSTIHNADRILVVDAGRIAEQGTHRELIERGGIYAKLIELQQT